MPQLSDLVEKRKFVKKSYRPWDLTGAGTVDNLNEEIIQTTSTSPEGVANPQHSLEEQCQIKEQTTIESPLVMEKKEIVDNKTGNELGNNQITIRQHLDNIEITSSKESGNKEVTTRQHKDNNLDNNISNAKNMVSLIESIKKLCGIQKNIFFLTINICTARGAFDTGNILTQELANAAGCNIGSAKTSLNRLVEKHLIIRHQGKASRGGHMMLGITKEIQAAAIQAQQAFFNPLKLSHLDNISGNITGNNSSSSSSSFNITTTTDLPSEWKKIDIRPLEAINFGFIEIKNIYKKCPPHIDCNVVQDSIKQFAFGLANNPSRYKTMSAPSGVLVKALSEGNPWIENGYISPEEKLRLEKENKITTLLEQQFKVPKFLDWFNTLNEHAKESLVPEGIKNSASYIISKTVMQKDHAKKHFDQIIWPPILSELKAAF